MTITPEALALSGAKYRKELLQMPVHSMQETVQHMNVRRGIRYAETVGELTGNIDLGPYSETRIDNDGMNIKGRTLYTFLGSVVKKFSPNSVVKSIYDSAITKGENLKTVDIALRVLSYLTAKLGGNLQSHIWNAVRNDSGTTSADLFNGFDTITTSEIGATTPNISTSIGNLFEFSEAITSSNAVDMIKAFCEAASEFLVDAGQQVKLFFNRQGSDRNFLLLSFGTPHIDHRTFIDTARGPFWTGHVMISGASVGIDALDNLIIGEKHRAEAYRAEVLAKAVACLKDIKARTVIYSRKRVMGGVII